MQNWADSDTFGNDLDTSGNDSGTIGDDRGTFGVPYRSFFEPPKTVNIEFADCYHFQHRFFRVPEIPLVDIEGLTHNP